MERMVSMQEAKARFAAKSEGMVSQRQVQTMKHSLELNLREATYELKIEATVPIHCVCVQSTVELQLLDSQNSVYILTVSATIPDSGFATLATYRCVLYDRIT